MGFCLIELNGVALLEESHTKHKKIKYQRDMYFCENLIDKNKNRIIMDGIRKIKIILVYQSLDIIINNMSIFPDSVREIIFSCKINGNLVLPERIEKVVFCDKNIICGKIHNIISWPENANYYTHCNRQYNDITNIVEMIHVIHKLLPLPIYEEISEHIFLYE